MAENKLIEKAQDKVTEKVANMVAEEIINTVIDNIRDIGNFECEDLDLHVTFKSLKISTDNSREYNTK